MLLSTKITSEKGTHCQDCSPVLLGQKRNLFCCNILCKVSRAELWSSAAFASEGRALKWPFLLKTLLTVLSPFSEADPAWVSLWIHYNGLLPALPAPTLLSPILLQVSVPEKSISLQVWAWPPAEGTDCPWDMTHTLGCASLRAWLRSTSCVPTALLDVVSYSKVPSTYPCEDASKNQRTLTDNKLAILHAAVCFVKDDKILYLKSSKALHTFQLPHFYSAQTWPTATPKH